MKRWLLDYMGRTEETFLFTMIISESEKDEDGVTYHARLNYAFETDKQMIMDERAKRGLKSKGLTDKQIEEAQQSLIWNRVRILFMEEK